MSPVCTLTLSGEIPNVSAAIMADPLEMSTDISVPMKHYAEKDKKDMKKLLQGL